MQLTRLARGLSVAGVLVLAAGQTATAGSLTETLITTYQQSPVLDSQRAVLRQIDEGVAISRAGLRPTIAVDGTAALNADDQDDFDPRLSLSTDLSASWVIYDHGQTAASIEASKARVAANRGILRNVEQTVLLDAVSAHMDVRRDLQSVQVAENNVTVLEQEVQATQDRFELGEVTRTDVSLAEARLASARANLQAFRGQLTTSRESYRAVVGVPPSNLAAPPGLPPLPGTLSEVEAIAIQKHPSLMAARFLQTAADFDLREAYRARRAPEVTLGGNIGVDDFENRLTGDRDTTLGVTGSITGSMTLFSGGQLTSAVRSAVASLDQAKFDVQDIARQIRQNAAVAWSNLAVARATIVANTEEVRAARIAFEGVREEARLGARTTLDVLDLEQQLRDAEFQLASSRRDEYVAAYQLLSTMGLLSVDHLQLGIPTYNPDVNYDRVQSGPSGIEKDILDQLRDRYKN